jgi:hypothetical protein
MGTLDKLKSEGSLVLYHDYRSGTLLDYSGIGNHGSGIPTFNRNGIDIGSNVTAVNVPDHLSLRLTTGSIVALAPYVVPRANGTFFSKRAGATPEYSFYLSTSALAVGGTVSSTIAFSAFAGKKCFACNFTDGAKPDLYVDGLFIGQGNVNNTLVPSTAAPRIGAWTSYLNNLSAICLVNRPLTASEHAACYAELSSVTWPSRSSVRSFCDMAVNPYQPNLVWAPKLNQPAVNGILPDVSPTGSNASVVGTTAPTFEMDALGGAHKFNGANGWTATGTSFTKTSDFTVNTIIRQDYFSGSRAIIGQQNRWILMFSGTTLRFATIGVKDYNAVGYTPIVGSTVCISAVFNTDYSVDFYINGVFLNKVTHAAGAAAGSGAFEVGLNNSSRYLISKIYRAEIYNRALSAAEIRTLYSQSGLLDIQESSQFGVPVSTAIRGGISGSYLETTRWAFGTSTPRYKIDVSTIQGKAVKTISCTTAGPLKKATDQQGTPQQAAYGVFEFSFYKGADANAPDIYLTSSTGGVIGDGVVNGYCFRVSAAEVITLVRVTAGASASTIMTIAPAISNTTWYRVKVTRDFAGNWKMYLLGGTYTGWTLVGSSAAPDNTHTSSAYQTLDLDALDLVSIGTIEGENSFSWSPFV